MAENSSIALHKSQASLHCAVKGMLYDIDMTLGKRIRAARKSRKLKLREVAKVFGITSQAVSLWEKDEAFPEVQKIAVLRKVLEVPFVWLLAGTGDPPPKDDPRTLLDAATQNDYEQKGAAAYLANATPAAPAQREPEQKRRESRPSRESRPRKA